MELALYRPGFGYYETQTHSPGRQGDFYTSVSTGDLFGQLLACRFAAWLEELRIGAMANGELWKRALTMESWPPTS